jgi:hypothetical protein
MIKGATTMPLNKKGMKGSDRMNGSLKTNEESVDELLLLQKKVNEQKPAADFPIVCALGLFSPFFM